MNKAYTAKAYRLGTDVPGGLLTLAGDAAAAPTVTVPAPPDGVGSYHVYLRLPREAVQGEVADIGLVLTDPDTGASPPLHDPLPGTQAMIRTEPAPFRRSLWIPWTIAGCFVIVVAVNVLMAWCAAWSWTGLVSPSAYDQGLTYNRNLAAETHQRMLGWQLPLRRPRAAWRRVELRDRDGAPLAGAEVTATLRAPGPRRQRLRPAARGRGRGRLRGAGDRARAGPVEGPRHRPPRRRPLRDRHPPELRNPDRDRPARGSRGRGRRARARRPPLRPRRARARAQRPPSAGRGRRTAAAACGGSSARSSRRAASRPPGST